MAKTASSARCSAAGERRGDQPEPDAAGDAGRRARRDERADEELALDRDVDHAGPLAEHTGQRAEDERDGGDQVPRSRLTSAEAGRPGCRRPPSTGATAGSTTQHDRRCTAAWPTARRRRRAAAPRPSDETPTRGRQRRPGPWMSTGAAPAGSRLSTKRASPVGGERAEERRCDQPEQAERPAAGYCGLGPSPSSGVPRAGQPWWTSGPSLRQAGLRAGGAAARSRKSALPAAARRRRARSAPGARATSSSGIAGDGASGCRRPAARRTAAPARAPPHGFARPSSATGMPSKPMLPARWASARRRWPRTIWRRRGRPGRRRSAIARM